MAKNMTGGSIPKLLIGFTIPTILGNLFQLTYNAGDAIIVGQFAGKNSLAAVGCANPIMNIIIFLIVGLCLGASVLMSEFFGANDVEKFKREVSTTIIIGFFFTIFVTILLNIFVTPILLLIRTPKDIVKDAAQYLHVIFAGLIFTFLYNVYAAALRSIGDSKSPIIFLIISSITNVCLDLIFVAGFHMGVFGAALSTVIAEAVSAILCIIFVYRKVEVLQIKKKEWVVDKQLLKTTVGYSWASAMQQTCLYIGKVLVQAAVNPLGVDSIATFNAVNRVDDFAFTPQQSIAHSMTVFIAQNRGAQKEERLRKGFRWGMLIEIIYGCVICMVVFIFAKHLMKIFIGKESNVIELGVVYLKAMAFFYLLPALTNGIQGYFRGMGKMKVTLASTFTQMLFRVLFSYILAPIFGIQGIAYSCFGGWVAMLIYEIPILVKDLKRRDNHLLQTL